MAENAWSVSQASLHKWYFQVQKEKECLDKKNDGTEQWLLECKSLGK